MMIPWMLSPHPPYTKLSLHSSSGIHEWFKKEGLYSMYYRLYLSAAGVAGRPSHPFVLAKIIVTTAEDFANQAVVAARTVYQLNLLLAPDRARNQADIDMLFNRIKEEAQQVHYALSL